MRINEMDSIDVMLNMLKRITEGNKDIKIELLDGDTKNRGIIISKRENGGSIEWIIRR